MLPSFELNRSRNFFLLFALFFAMSMCSECSEGTCCHNGKLRPSGFVCYRGTGCEVLETVCNGVTPNCPPIAFRPDGSPCGSKNEGVCVSGKCVTDKDSLNQVSTNNNGENKSRIGYDENVRVSYNVPEGVVNQEYNYLAKQREANRKAKIEAKKHKDKSSVPATRSEEELRLNTMRPKDREAYLKAKEVEAQAKAILKSQSKAAAKSSAASKQSNVSSTSQSLASEQANVQTNNILAETTSNNNSVNSISMDSTSSDTSNNISTDPIQEQKNVNENQISVVNSYTTPFASISPERCNGKCCMNNKLMPSGTSCYVSSSSCIKSSVCDGLNPFCPAPQNAEDGTDCENGGKCKSGLCVKKLCFGDCCDTISQSLAIDGTKCGFNKKGKCKKGICYVPEESTPEYIEKQNKKVNSYTSMLDKLFESNEVNAVKKATRWFSSIRRNLKKRN